MQRITISLDEELAAAFDALQRDAGYASRSEAVRDLVRQAVAARRIDESRSGSCVASLSYVYDYRTRTLAARLMAMQHDHHDLVLTTNRVVLDHSTSLEMVVLRGATQAVQGFADQVRAERGVRFAAMNIIGIDPNDDHAGVHDHHHHGHAHATPQIA